MVGAESGSGRGRTGDAATGRGRAPGPVFGVALGDASRPGAAFRTGSGREAPSRLKRPACSLGSPLSPSSDDCSDDPSFEGSVQSEAISVSVGRALGRPG